MESTYSNPYFGRTSFEEKINSLGKIPVIGTFVGAGRIAAGTMQVLIGLIKGCALPIFRMFKRQNPKFQNKDWNWAASGAENFLRGIVELIPGVSYFALTRYDKWRLQNQKQPQQPNNQNDADSIEKKGKKPGSKSKPPKPRVDGQPSRKKKKELKEQNIFKKARLNLEPLPPPPSQVPLSTQPPQPYGNRTPEPSDEGVLGRIIDATPL